MHHLHECAEPAPTKSAAEPLHSVGDSAAADESIVEPLHSADDLVVVESIADSNAVANAPTDTSYI
jgi:hypothetical protein